MSDSTKKWTRDEIDALLKERPEAVERAILVLWNRQTDDEQASQDTKHHNARGFSAAAAHLGSYYAKWLLAGKHLTGLHLDKALRIALRHSKQLVEEANAKAEARGA
jgi:hypothetical protein